MFYFFKLNLLHLLQHTSIRSYGLCYVQNNKNMLSPTCWFMLFSDLRQVAKVLVCICVCVYPYVGYYSYAWSFNLLFLTLLTYLLSVLFFFYHYYSRLFPSDQFDIVSMCYPINMSLFNFEKQLW